MRLPRALTGLFLITIMALPAMVISQDGAYAAGAKKAEWRTPKTEKKAATPSKVAPVAAIPKEQATERSVEAQVPPAALVNSDQSQEVLDVDFAMAAAIANMGPKDGYAKTISDVGILYDANGPSPPGQEAAVSRFATFPADVKLIRKPESALAAGGSGSSWGSYSIQRGDTILSGGRYISVWRREGAGWKMISELAAGKAPSPPTAAAINGVLPRRPMPLNRAAPTPIGVPLTVPTPPASATLESPPTATPPAP
jgi:hypothetical protein